MSVYLQPLKKYADFTGRAARSEYWGFYLFVLAVTFGSALLAALSAAAGVKALAYLVVAAIVIFSLGTIIPFLAVGVRRLHDRDMSGWWMLLSLIPYAGGIILMVLFALPGTPGDNRFGADPLANEASL